MMIGLNRFSFILWNLFFFPLSDELTCFGLATSSPGLPQHTSLTDDLLLYVSLDSSRYPAE